MSLLEQEFFNFCKIYKRLPAFTETYNGQPVGRWRWRINDLYLRGKISASLAKKLDSLPYWKFNKDGWYNEFENLEYTFKHQHGASEEQKLWLEKQSELFLGFKLVDEKSKLLDSLPITWLNLSGNQKKLIYKWFERLELLKSFYDKFKKLPSNKYRGKEDFRFDLYGWLNRQRKYYRNGKLKIKQIQLLNDIEKDWHLNEVKKSFYSKISYLKTYYDKNRSYPDSNGWLIENRMHYRQGKLPNWKVIEFEKLKEWEWTPREAKFFKAYEIVKDFLIKNKRVPKMGESWQGINISTWITSARSRYKEGGTYPNKEKAELLGKLPYFSWDKQVEEWNRNFSLIKNFLKENGRYPIPKEVYKGANIGSWLGTQRSRYKKGTLLDGEKQSLVSLNNWTWSPFDDIWNQKYKKYKTEFDSGLSEESIKWSRKQRARYTKGLMEKERTALLEQLPEWTWSVYETKWLNNYNELLRYIGENQEYPSCKSKLGMWIYNQITDFRNQGMSIKRIDKLEQLSAWRWTADGSLLKKK